MASGGLLHGMRGHAVPDSGVCAHSNAAMGSLALHFTALMQAVGVESQPSPEACCRSCRQRPNCTVWNYCKSTGGCRLPVGGVGVTLQQGECESQWAAAAPVGNVRLVSGGDFSG